MSAKVGKGAFEAVREIWSRRRWTAIVVFAGCGAAACSAVLSLPDVYRSTATVLVEREQVPESVIRPAVPAEPDVRLQTISERILSRARLAGIVERFGLYPDM